MFTGEVIEGKSGAKFRLYLHDEQSGKTGREVLGHLYATGQHLVSIEDETVQGWLADQSSYPEELKKFSVFLWLTEEAGFVGCSYEDGLRSQSNPPALRAIYKHRIACLDWYKEHLLVSYVNINADWGWNPALVRV